MLTFRRIAAVMAPLAIAAGGFMMAAPAQAAPCSNSGYLCFWVNSGYSGEMGKVAGDNSNFANLPKNGGGTWNDVISSAYNHGNSDYVALYSNSGYSGFSECLSIGANNSSTQNFTNISTGTFPWDNFNDVASSNDWYTPGSSPPHGCSHTN
jgi:hypothetical protein